MEHKKVFRTIIRFSYYTNYFNYRYKITFFTQKHRKLSVSKYNDTKSEKGKHN